MANESVNLGWLKNYDNTKFAPKTTLNSVLTAGGAANSVVITGATDKDNLTTREITNNTTDTAVAGSTNIPTMHTLYRTLARINNADQTHATTIYAPTSTGTNGQFLKSTGSGAPVWDDLPQNLSVSAETDTSTNEYYVTGVASSSSTALKYYSGVKIKTNVLLGAAWNDYAEYRQTKTEIEPGRCIRELGDDTLELTTKRLERGCEIVSDTFGFAIGETEKSKTPIAATGRALVYLYEGREAAMAHIGWPVCSGPDGTVSIMTEEEEEKYPSRIIGTISAVPDYEEWGAGKIKVNGRVWIRIK